MHRPPSVDELARSLESTGLPHPLRVEVARAAIRDDLVDDVLDLARTRRRRLLQPVINATGVLLHTNLGRAPLEHSVAASASNLELDLETGKRGSRQQAVGSLLATAVGAEAALVVNNCAAGVLLALAAVVGDKAAAVSRGELVEIGGGFRIPDVMERSGAQMVEVGTTNRTRLADYRRAADDHDLAAVLSVHRSNYRIEGFTESVGVTALATLGVPVIVDLGSGLLDASCPWLDGPPPRWLAEEPAVRQTLQQGADLVIFSGDKLFGGPQAGIIVGRSDLVSACGRHALARALRPGGLVLDALQATTLRYLERDGDAIPFWRMATTPVDALRDRAERIVAALPPDGPEVTVIDTEAVPGGGTMPGVTIPSVGVRVADPTALDRLRDAERPVIARVDGGATVLDLRTVDPGDDEAVIRALRRAALGGGSP